MALLVILSENYIRKEKLNKIVLFYFILLNAVKGECIILFGDNDLKIKLQINLKVSFLIYSYFQNYFVLYQICGKLGYL